MGVWKNSIGVITRLKRGHASDRYAAFVRALVSLPCATNGSHLARVLDIKELSAANTIQWSAKGLVRTQRND